MTALDSLLNLLFPSRCATCKREGDFLCADCVGTLKIKRIKSNSKSQTSEFKYLDGLIYGLDYANNPVIKDAIKQFKYYYTKELVAYFAQIIQEKLNELYMTNKRSLIFIPVPLHKKRYNSRGFNQAEVIAKAIKKGDVLQLLIRKKNTSQQAKLSKKAREKNLKDAFELNKKCVQQFDANKIYFIVDDVCTTGSTLEECAKVLKENGFKRVYGLTVARAFK